MRSEQCRADEVDSWTVLKSIQEANAASMGAMEQYLLFAVRPDAVGSIERTQALLKRSIARHEQVIEQLELAVDEIDSTTVGEK